MKVHKDMKKDMTRAMDKALKSVSRETLAKVSWFSTIEEAYVDGKGKGKPK